MPNFIAALGDEYFFRSGDFSDTGQYRYLRKTADGQDYPVSKTVSKFGMDMDGNVIPLYAQMEIKCSSGSWNAVGGLVQVTLANMLVGEPCYALATLPFFRQVV